MPYKTWAVGEELLAADMNAYIQQQVVATFATAAARDAAIPTPVTGQTCYLADALGHFVYDGTAWRAMPKGRLGFLPGIARDATQGLTLHAQLSFTLPTARIVRVEASVQYAQITGASNASQYCNVGFDGGRNAFFGVMYNLVLGGSGGGSGLYMASLAAGAHTAEIHLVNNSSVGAMRVQAGASGGSWLAITDVGGI